MDNDDFSQLLTIEMKNKIVFSFALLFSATASSQSSILLEACNNLVDSEKRLVCLKEILRGNGEKSSKKDESFEKLKNSFLGLQGLVNSGVNYRVYAEKILEPAQAIQIFSANQNGEKFNALRNFQEALDTYKDAEILWRAYVTSSRDGGLFVGRVLDYKNLGLSYLIEKYQLPTTTVLLTSHVELQPSLRIMWARAEAAFNAGVAAIEQREADGSVANQVESVVDISDGSRQQRIYEKIGLLVDETNLEIKRVNFELNPEVKVGGFIHSINYVRVANLRDVSRVVHDPAYRADGFPATIIYDGLSRYFYVNRVR